jgi:hypothetical protein
MLGLYLASAVALGALVIGFLLALDPYDTGRLSMATGYGVPFFDPRLTGASLGREPRMDSAIIGNSTIQLISPAHLSLATAENIVALVVPGTGPLEQLIVADYFLRLHRNEAVRAMIFGIDGTWCSAAGKLEFLNPFPTWLYSASSLDYAVNMIRLKSFEAVTRKLKLLRGRAPAVPQNGYRDYEVGRIWDAGAARQRLSQAAADAYVPDQDAATDDIAGAPLLERFLEQLPSSVWAVLVIPPRYRDPEATPAASAVARQRACTAAYRKVAHGRAKTAMLDFIEQKAIAGPDEFWDPIHYRAPVARRMEAAIAAALRQGG